MFNHPTIILGVVAVILFIGLILAMTNNSKLRQKISENYSDNDLKIDDLKDLARDPVSGLVKRDRFAILVNDAIVNGEWSP